MTDPTPQREMTPDELIEKAETFEIIDGAITIPAMWPRLILERERASRPDPTPGPDALREAALALKADHDANGHREPGMGVEADVEYCGDCDGTGWVEGGSTIKTTCARCGGTGIEPPAKPIGYRYEITAVWGDVPAGVVVGGFIVDPEFKGDVYSWEVMDLPTGTVMASWDGRYVGVRSLEPVQ